MSRSIGVSGVYQERSSDDFEMTLNYTGHVTNISDCQTNSSASDKSESTTLNSISDCKCDIFTYNSERTRCINLQRYRSGVNEATRSAQPPSPSLLEWAIFQRRQDNGVHEFGELRCLRESKWLPKRQVLVWDGYTPSKRSRPSRQSARLLHASPSSFPAI